MRLILSLTIMMTTPMAMAWAAPDRNASIDMSLEGQEMRVAPLPSQPRSKQQPETNEPTPGMRHLNVAPAPAKKPDPTDPSPDTRLIAKPPEQNYHPISPAEALVKPDKLKPWANLSQVLLVQSKADATNLIKAIEADRGAVPPQGLFLAAQALAGQDMMEQATLYYLIGQLRLSFDTTRWPPYASEEVKERKKQNERKSAEQRLPGDTDDTPSMNNPHSYPSALAETVGPRILRWAVRHPAEFDHMIAAAHAWDHSARFAYDPGYTVGPSIPYEDWEGALNSTRTAYFASMQNVMKNIRAIKR